MTTPKKAAAFLAALTICLSAVPAGIVHGEPETSTTASTEATTEAATETAEETFTSGCFKYIKLTENTVSIEDCTSTDEELVVPETLDGKTVTELGRFAFSKNYRDNPYVKITLPKTIEYISAYNPFVCCEKLTDIIVDPESSYFKSEDGILFSKDGKKLVCYPIMKEGSAYTVPDGVEELGSSAIYSTMLTEINLPSSLAKMGTHALSFNNRVATFDLSKTAVTDIPDFCFAECTYLSKVLFPPKLERIGMRAFQSCTHVEKVDLPEGLVTIGQHAFFDTALKRVYIPASVESIDYCAFGYEKSQSGEELVVKDFTIIGEYRSAAHIYCTESDSEYDYKNNFNFRTKEEAAEEEELLSLEQKQEGDYMYAEVDGKAVITFCSAEGSVVTVPGTMGGLEVAGIYPSAFQACKAEEIILPDTVTYLKKIAFYNCTKLKKITLPGSLRTIGENAFDSCTALETVNIGGTVTVEANAFNGCTSLKELTISGSCKEIKGNAPFSSCTALEKICVSGDGDGNFASIDGVLFSKDKSELVFYPIARSGKSYKVPKNVKKIKSFAFIDCRYLEDVVLSKELTELEECAIYNCPNLMTIRAYNKLEKFGNCAFGYRYKSSTSSAAAAAAVTNTDNGSNDELVSGFKLYAAQKSKAYKYAQDNGIEVITGTIRIGNSNYRIGMIGLIAALAAAVIGAFVGLFANNKIKKKTTSEKSGDAGSKKKAVKDKEDKEDAEDEKDED